MIRPIVRPLIRPLIRSLIRGGGGTPGGDVVHLIASDGNSHTTGRSSALGGDAFNIKVLQYAGSTDIIEAPIGAQLDHNDTNQGVGQYSPDLSFTDQYLIDNPSITNVVIVPYGQGASGLSTLWDPNLVTGDRLQTAVDRFNTAKLLLEAQGKTVVVSGFLWHNANPDYNNFTYEEHLTAIDSMIGYIRANLSGGSSVPIVIGGGMMKEQLDGRSVNDTRFTANLTGAEHRHGNVASYDNINPQYGYSSGIPLTIFDGIHCDRDSEIVKGILRNNSLKRAKLNTNPSAPFTATDYYMFFDFRSGSGLDFSGNDYNLSDNGTFPPLIRYASDVEQLVYDRPNGAGRAFKMSQGLPQSYTINFFYKPDAINSCGFIYNSSSPTANQTRFGILSSGTELRGGHLGSSSDVSVNSNLLTVGAYSLISLSYDAVSTTMKLAVDGVEVDSNTSVPNHDSIDPWFGTQNTNVNPITGDVAYCSIADYAMSDSELLAENVKAQSLIV